jgi:hypothetical protein
MRKLAVFLFGLVHMNAEETARLPIPDQADFDQSDLELR